MSKTLEQNIREFLQEWIDQDTRGTRWPFYVTIRDCHINYQVTINGNYVYDAESESLVSIEEKIKEILQDDRLNAEDYETLGLEGPQDIENVALDCFNTDDYLDVLKNHDIIEPNAVTFEEVEEWYEEGVFFTVKDAEEYLESCRNHHTDNAHTYIKRFTAWGRDSKTESFIENIFNYFGIEQT